MRDYFMTSERLGFSVWTEDDEELAKELWGDPEVTRYISANGVFSPQQIKDRLALEIDNQKRFGMQYWPIFELESGLFAGVCGLRPHKPSINMGLEIGCHLRPGFWGKGLAVEASNRVIEYAFEEFKARSVFAGHNPDNLRSAEVAKKLGLNYIGTEYYPPTGLMHPSYRLSRKEYLARLAEKEAPTEEK